eukprot:CAMPEP_0170112204 /NCGR_PEP_ID=MMETSP0020_2-20130122/8978_1 /TAXON_ID=98059 /ORGANISM="Dinobryon sp., Strain UTEXLB2267" /LENGTH=150 /DNA_ID=CAMNT_0010337973 /DNA_START=936 /DNA_END=1388 /DNA_ORIENTATION=-
MVTEVREVQWEKAFVPIPVTVVGIKTTLMVVQFLNASLGMKDTSLGMVMIELVPQEEHPLQGKYMVGANVGTFVDIIEGLAVGILLGKPPGVLHCPMGFLSSGAIQDARLAFFATHLAPGLQQVFTVMQLPKSAVQPVVRYWVVSSTHCE